MLDPAINVFLCVAEQCSFTKAAQFLFVTPTAVMKQINRLESYVGVPLFTRTHAGVELTPAGKAYEARMRSIAEESVTARTEAQAIAHKQNVSIRIGDAPYHSCKQLVHMWHAIMNRSQTSNVARRFSIQVVHFSEGDFEPDNDVPRGLGPDFDVVLGNFDDKKHDARHTFIPLAPTLTCILAPISHRLASRGVIVPTDLAGEHLLIPCNENTQFTNAVFDDLLQHSPDINIERTPFRFNDLDKLANRCVQDNALLVAMDWWTELHPMLAPVQVDWPYTLSHGLIYRSDCTASVHEFTRLIQDEAYRHYREDTDDDHRWIAEWIAQGRSFTRISEAPAPR